MTVEAPSSILSPADRLRAGARAYQEMAALLRKAGGILLDGDLVTWGQSDPHTCRTKELVSGKFDYADHGSPVGGSVTIHVTAYDRPNTSKNALPEDVPGWQGGNGLFSVGLHREGVAPGELATVGVTPRDWKNNGTDPRHALFSDPEHAPEIAEAILADPNCECGTVPELQALLAEGLEEQSQIGTDIVHTLAKVTGNGLNTHYPGIETVSAGLAALVDLPASTPSI